MHLGNLKALSSALNAKDYYTLGHAAPVGAYVVLLGHELGRSEEQPGKWKRSPTCTTSARSASPTVSCSSPAG